MEWVDGKSFNNCDELHEHEQLKSVIKQISLVLYYIHQANYIYFDLKPENILLDAAGHCKISDFGVSHYFSDETKVPLDDRHSKKLSKEEIEKLKSSKFVIDAKKNRDVGSGDESSGREGLEVLSIPAAPAFSNARARFLFDKPVFEILFLHASVCSVLSIFIFSTDSFVPNSVQL